MKLIIVEPKCEESTQTMRLDRVLENSLPEIGEQQKFPDIMITWARTVGELERIMDASGKMQDVKLLFAVSLGSVGINMELYSMLRWIRMHPNCLAGCTAGVLIDGDSELYTKAVAREIVFTANMSGCLFVGRPLVEGTKILQNFQIAAANLETTLQEAYLEAAKLLINRLVKFQMPRRKKPHVLCLHASNCETSNTLSLWKMVRGHLQDKCQIQEIALQNGKIYDCLGCSYQMCFRYSQKTECFYGGMIVEEVYPAIEKCDILLMLCPNYNDALGANLTAFINRLTALFRKRQFYDKYLFSIIVSGYSGSDIIARQLIGSMNMNKTFILPGNFALMETANAPGSIYRVESIRRKAADFADSIVQCAVG